MDERSESTGGLEAATGGSLPTIVQYRSLNRLSVLSTVVDGAVALLRGRPQRAAVLLGAAALGSRVGGLGTAASVLVRLWRRLR